MNSEQINEALAYNTNTGSKHYDETDLLYPFSSTAPGSVKRVLVAAAFQMAAGLDIDGCLGPLTFAAIKKTVAPKKERPAKPAKKKQRQPRKNPRTESP